MKYAIAHRVVVLLVSSVIAVAATWADEKPAFTSDETVVPIQMNVFKSPTCGCCGEWVEHIEERGFATTSNHPKDLAGLKKELGIAPEYQSCHTGVTNNGYVFEGHIPAHLIKQFLASPPKDAIGLAVPGMPMGSPGMEMGDHFSAYDVLLLNKDGTTKVYAKVDNADSQY